MIASILGSALLTPLLESLGGILATLITGYLVKFLSAKTGIALDANQQAQAKQIVQAVEEKAIAAVKTCMTKPTGEQKHAQAVTQLQTLNPTMTDSAAISQVDRAVGSLPNVGATALKVGDCKISSEIPAIVSQAAG